MKHLKHLFTTLMLLFTTAVAAHDFEVDGIYYNTTDATNKTLEVTFRGSYSDSYDNEYTGSVVIPESVIYNGNTYSVTSIGEQAFWGCSGLTSIEIPNSVTNIGENAFYFCSGLTSIVIPNSVTSIGYDAFYNTAWYNNQPDGVVYAGRVLYKYKGTMPENTSIVVKEGTLEITSSAFYNCSGLTSIVIPNSVKSIGNYVFARCSGLTSIVVDGNNTKYDSRENCNAIIETETNTLILGCKNSVIPNSVTSIGDYAFYFCTGLTSIEIPNSVTSIGGSAFSYCYGLTSIEIPNSVTNIGEDAFYFCSCLTSIEIPNSVTSIESSAFYGCTGLTSIVIGNSVTSIGNYAFSACSGLKTVINLSNLTFSKGSSNNGFVAFYADKVINAPNGFIDGDFVWYENENVMTLAAYLGNAKELTLPTDYNGENYVIGNEAFYFCSGLTSIEIPNSVTSIGYEAFKGCTNIETLYIGNSIESIGNNAFAGCEKIKEITIGVEKPIWGDVNFFEKSVYDKATLFVPAGTKSLYEKREPWNLFFYIEEMDFTDIDDVKAENGEVKTIYDLQGRNFDTISKGFYIINGKKVLIK